MKKTLLEIVQDVLSDLGGDEVNSFNDTVESAQVANVVRSVYEAMMVNRDWPHQRRVVSLESYGNLLLPTHTKLPEKVKKVISIMYDVSDNASTRRRYTELKFLEPESFLRMVYSRDSGSSNILSVTDPSGSPLFVYKDRQPTYFTSFDDVTVVFDSYDLSEDDTIQESKFTVTAFVLDEWEHDDNFIPNIPPEAFPALIEESKSRCAMKVMQRADQASAIEAKRQQTWLSRQAWRVNGGIKIKSFGRRGKS